MSNLPRRALLGLCIATCFISAPAAFGQQADEKQLAALRERFGLTYRQKNWSKAVELGLQIEQLQPNQSSHEYNLACAYARGGDAAKAAEWVRRAAENGFSQLYLLEHDDDLAGVREQAEYAAVLEVVRAGYAKKRERMQAWCAQREPLIIVPVGHDSQTPAPLLIALHGFGGSPRGYPTYWKDAAAEIGAILAIPHGNLTGPQGGFAWNTRDVDEADLIVEFTIEFVKAHHAVDAGRIILTGFSQGGFVAYAVGERHPETFRGVVAMGAGYIPAIDRPTSAPEGQKPRFYFMAGEYDGVRQQTRQAAQDFAKAGYECEFTTYRGVGHRFPRETDGELQRALRYVLSE